MPRGGSNRRHCDFQSLAWHPCRCSTVPKEPVSCLERWGKRAHTEPLSRFIPVSATAFGSKMIAGQRSAREMSSDQLIDVSAVANDRNDDYGRWLLRPVDHPVIPNTNPVIALVTVQAYRTRRMALFARLVMTGAMRRWTSKGMLASCFSAARVRVTS